jgi:hypothetical protein
MRGVPKAGLIEKLSPGNQSELESKVQTQTEEEPWLAPAFWRGSI